MKYHSSVIFFCLLAMGCDSNKKDTGVQSGLSKDTAIIRKYSQLNIKADFKTPTVGIDSFILITDNPEVDLKEAKAIMRAKVLAPLAMQKHDASLFDSFLAKKGTFRSENSFYEREEFIRNRVNAQWEISYVQYENLVLQLFGEIALLTYRNYAIEKDEKGMPRKWRGTWADIWIKEDGKWKAKAGHLIEERVEKK